MKIKDEWRNAQEGYPLIYAMAVESSQSGEIVTSSTQGYVFTYIGRMQTSISTPSSGSSIDGSVKSSILSPFFNFIKSFQRYLIINLKDINKKFKLLIYCKSMATPRNSSIFHSSISHISNSFIRIVCFTINNFTNKKSMCSKIYFLYSF